MEPKEIKIEKNVYDKKINVDSSAKNTSSYSTIINNNGMSFEDFMNDQLTYLSFCNTNSSKTKKEDETKTETNKPEETPNLVSTQNKQSKDANQHQQTNINEIRQMKDPNEIYLNLDGKKLTKNDMENIQNLANDPNFSVNINQTNGFNNVSINYNDSGINHSSLNFSQNLSEAMKKAYKSNQPIRIEVEKDTSVILKIDKEGKVSAHFISSDKAMEMLLRDHIYQLRDKLDKEGLPYKSLTYNQDKEKNKDKENNQNQ